eukprot:gene19706-26981_t
MIPVHAQLHPQLQAASRWPAAPSRLGPILKECRPSTAASGGAQLFVRRRSPARFGNNGHH